MSGVWDPQRAELDTVPPYPPTRPALNYVVCATPRTGSGLLCRGLASTGQGGQPAEYFNPNQRGPLAERWETGPSLPAYAAALRAHRTSPGGIFGTKLQWNQLRRIRRELQGEAEPERPYAIGRDCLDALIPDARFVRIVRLDVDRQAISLWNAQQRGIWSVRAGIPSAPTSAPRYDGHAIARLRNALVLGELGWDRFFRGNNIRPVEAEFEALTADYPQTVSRVMRELLGIEISPGEVPSPDSEPQGYPESDDVYRRFTAEFGSTAMEYGPPRPVPRLRRRTRRRAI